MISKKQALEYEIGRMSLIKTILHELPFYHYFFIYRFNLRYHRYQEFMNNPLNHQVNKSNI
jgi:hypothetical protein